MNQSRIKLAFVQPLLPSYREGMVQVLAERYSLIVLCGHATTGSGFAFVQNDSFEIIDCPHVSIYGGRLLWQRGVIGAVLKRDIDKVLACANPRDLTYWALLIVCALKRTPIFSHGQGLYSKRKVSILMGLMYRLIVALSEKYIAYTPLSRDSLLKIGVSPTKVAVADNTVDVETGPIPIVKSGIEPGVLFLGRLREECGLEVLVEAVERLRLTFSDMEVHVIGGGELEEFYRNKFRFDWVKFYGAIYDEHEIATISASCRVGCYPGNAGLSVVHYFALRLPPVLHGDLPLHMGPEPSYVTHWENGVLFERGKGVSGLMDSLGSVWTMPKCHYLELSEAAYGKYQSLRYPSLGDKFVSIMGS